MDFHRHSASLPHPSSLSYSFEERGRGDEKGLKTWKVLVTDDVEQDLDNIVYYLLVEKMNDQAAKAVLDDYDETIARLERVAGSLGYLRNKCLADLGYRKIKLKRHHYYLLYRIEGDVAVVDHMYHELQDIDNVLI